jgi:hypothetical protein
MSRTDLRRYLLGDLSDEEQERIERRYFADDDALGELLSAEDDLVEAFLAGDLPPGERSRFEHHFLATDRGRNKVAMTAALARRHPALRQRGWRGRTGLALAASLALLAIGGALVRELVVTRRQVEQLETQQQLLRQEIAALAGELQRARSAPAADPAPARIVAFVLTGGMERGPVPASTLTIPEASAGADLWLLLRGPSYSSYSASLQTVEGRQLYSQQSLSPGAIDGRRAVLFRVPSTHLTPATYVIALSGARGNGAPEPVDDFSVSVRRP